MAKGDGSSTGFSRQNRHLLHEKDVCVACEIPWSEVLILVCDEFPFDEKVTINPDVFIHSFIHSFKGTLWQCIITSLFEKYLYSTMYMNEYAICMDSNGLARNNECTTLVSWCVDLMISSRERPCFCWSACGFACFYRRFKIPPWLIIVLFRILVKKYSFDTGASACRRIKVELESKTN